MADIGFSVSNTSGFLPQIWAQRALDVLRSNMVLAKTVTRDSKFEPGWRGQQLNIPYPGTFSASDKSADTPTTVSVPSGGATVNVPLSYHKYVDFIVEDYAAAQADMSLMDRYTQPAAIALAEAVETTLVGLVANSTNATQGTRGTDISASSIRSANLVLNQAKVPRNGRVLILSPKDEMAALGDSNLQTYFAYAQAQDIREGSLARIYGFDTYMSQFMQSGLGASSGQTITITGTPTGGTFTITFKSQTTGNIAYNATAATVKTAFTGLSSVGAGNANVTGGPGPGTPWVITFAGTLADEAQTAITTTDSLTGGSTPASAVTQSTSGYDQCVAFHPDFMILATRPFVDPPAGSGVQVSQTFDAESGLYLRTVHQYDIGNRGVHVGFDILYGAVTLRPTFGAIINT